MGTLVVMGRSGDTKVTWDVGDPVQVAEALTKFEELKTAGMLTFRVDGETNRQIDQFESDAERILVIPPVVGG